MKTKLLLCVGLAIAVSISVTVIVQAIFFQNLHLRFSNALYGREVADPKVVIVGIDQKSLDDEVGLGRFQDWRRTYYAKAIENLNAAGAKTIGLDLLFNRRARGLPEEDLIAMVKPFLKPQDNASPARRGERAGLDEGVPKSGTTEESPSSINNKDPAEILKNLLKSLATYLKSDGHPDDISFGKTLKEAGNVFIALFGIAEVSENGLSTLKTVFDPIDPIKNSAQGFGMANVFPDTDNVIRRIPLKYQFESRTELPLSLAIISRLNLGAIPNENGMMVNFGKTPFPQISFVDVYRNDFDKTLVKDKIVLIGTTATSLQDLHFTPLDQETPTPGVEIHGHAVQTILDNAFLKNLGKQNQFLLMIFLTAFIGVATSFLPLTFSVGAFVIVTIGYIFAAKFFFDRGVILNMVSPFFGISITYIGMLMYRYFTEYSQKRMIRKAFQHYVNSTVVEEIVKNPALLKLGGERKEITVMFTDLENFTPLAEKLLPEEMVKIINAYMDEMSKIIFKHGGTIDKFEGDAIMAFFGAPLDQPDHAARACACAIEMQKITKFPMRIGISTGPAIVGNMGSFERFEYTAMGDIVNLGARLEPLNKETKTKILISEKTFQALNGKFQTRALGAMAIKGKAEKAAVYELSA